MTFDPTKVKAREVWVVRTLDRERPTYGEVVGVFAREDLARSFISRATEEDSPLHGAVLTTSPYHVNT